jgi:hypothetical protein
MEVGTMETKSETVSISIGSARLLYNILTQTTLAVGSDDFDELAPAVLTAKRELSEALNPPHPRPEPNGKSAAALG